MTTNANEPLPQPAEREFPSDDQSDLEAVEKSLAEPTDSISMDDFARRHGLAPLTAREAEEPIILRAVTDFDLLVRECDACKEIHIFGFYHQLTPEQKQIDKERMVVVVSGECKCGAKVSSEYDVFTSPDGSAARVIAKERQKASDLKCKLLESSLALKSAEQQLADILDAIPQQHRQHTTGVLESVKRLVAAEDQQAQRAHEAEGEVAELRRQREAISTYNPQELAREVGRLRQQLAAAQAEVGRLTLDSKRLDAILGGQVTVEPMGTTKPYLNFETSQDLMTTADGADPRVVIDEILAALKEPTPDKRKPLVERVEWTAPRGTGFEGRLGGLSIRIWPHGHSWRVQAAGYVDTYFKVDGDVEAAKAEALRIVQRAVLEAAEAWKD